MMKRIFVPFALCAAVCLSASARNLIEVRTDSVLGEVGMMNCVGGGPAAAVDARLYKAAGIPFARLHDVGFDNEHTVEIMSVFPKFEADENDPASYDFAMTDAYVGGIIGTGTRILWRLGNSHHESGGMPRHYGAWPPRDFAKWARICEHVIRHYNEGWADGFHYGIDMWEIWNEPDGDQKALVDGKPRWQVDPHSWGGTMEQYYEFYSTVFKHLKATCPGIRIGGPANAGFWANDPFMQAMIKAGVKPDFFTWHRYCHDPETLSEESVRLRELLDRYGWDDVPSILDEWNYQRSWTPDGCEYSTGVRRSIKGAAFVAAGMCHMQDAGCVDMMMYHHFRPTTDYNGVSDRQTGTETATYYVFYDWNKLRQYGTRVKVDILLDGEGDEARKDIYAAAAKSADGRVRMLLSRYNEDDNVHNDKVVYVAIPKGCTGAVCTLSDKYHMNTRYPFPTDDGAVKLTLKPNSVVFMDFK